MEEGVGRRAPWVVGGRRLAKLLRIEILALCGLLLAALAVLAFDLKFYFPDSGTAAFVWRHYVSLLVPSLLVCWLVVLLTKRPHMMALDYLTYSCRQVLAFLLVLYLHFNFKLWAQLVNPKRFDDIYNTWDLSLDAIVSLFSRASGIIHRLVPDGMNAYHELFVAMFALSYLGLSLTGRWRRLESALFATSIVLLVGGVCYAIAPALGPLVYGYGPGVAKMVQTGMLARHLDFISSGGMDYDGSRFVAALAAMPSLHVANALVFTYYSWRYVRVLAVPFTLLTLYFCIDAVALRWHYLIDIPVGSLLACFAVWVSDGSEKFFDRKETPVLVR